MQQLILASTSTLHGSGYLEYLLPDLEVLFKDAKNILFIPYARPSGMSHDEYTQKVQTTFLKIGKTITGIHTHKNPIEAIQNAEAIFVGGGNTFVLLYQLYKNQLLDPLKTAVKNGTPYLGTSAGSNICGLTIKTTNDMPIVYPPSFNALGLVPFNINPHYTHPDLTSKHMGETRDTRIHEFHHFNTPPVIGLREGSWLCITDDSIKLKGTLPAKIFELNKAPYEINPNTELSHLK